MNKEINNISNSFKDLIDYVLAISKINDENIIYDCLIYIDQIFEVLFRSFNNKNTPIELNENKLNSPIFHQQKFNQVFFNSIFSDGLIITDPTKNLINLKEVLKIPYSPKHIFPKIEKISSYQSIVLIESKIIKINLIKILFFRIFTSISNNFNK